MNEDKMDILLKGVRMLVMEDENIRRRTKDIYYKLVEDVINPPKEQTQYEKTEPIFGNYANCVTSEVKK